MGISLPISEFPNLSMDLKRLPRHIAIVMDGNGRWAVRRGLPRNEGHRRAKDSVRAVVEAAREIGIPNLSLFAFSTENWARPSTEVNFLMRLFHRYLLTEAKRLMKRDIRVVALGDTTRLAEPIRRALDKTVEMTAGNSSMTLGLALSYGGRQDLVAAVRKIAADAKAGLTNPDEIDEATIANSLATASIPDPDLLIRTSGEQRISNFFLFQLAYTELYFTDTLWPDFREREFLSALGAYQARERRYGMVPTSPDNRLRAQS
jgi:undecaprenyl diphosphate synthase